MHIKFVEFPNKIISLRGHDMLFHLGIIHFSLCGYELCKSFIGNVFPLGEHEILNCLLIKLFLSRGHEIY